MMVMPHPAAMADAVIKWVAHADMNAKRADMRARADAARSGARACAYRADLGTGANLCVCGCSKNNSDCKYRSGQRFHFHIPRSGKNYFVQIINGCPEKEFRDWLSGHPGCEGGWA